MTTAPRDRPPFDRVWIVGVGLVGGSIALAVRRRWPSIVVGGIDRRAVLRTRACRALGIELTPDLSACRSADLVILAAPVRANIATLERLAALGGVSALVTDVGSTKSAICSAASALGSPAFFGGHPIAGGERSGAAWATPDLFVGADWVLMRSGTGRAAEARRLRRFVRGLGAVVRRMTPRGHDALYARVSHMPQLVASALMLAAGRAGRAGLARAGRGLVDGTRLASSSPEMWVDVCATNAAAIRGALADVLGELTALERALADDRALAARLAAAGAARSELERIWRPKGRRVVRGPKPEPRRL